ncbi:10868_t:CDS:1, partial [Dentiscutata heterogama]
MENKNNSHDFLKYDMEFFSLEILQHFGIHIECYKFDNNIFYSDMKIKNIPIRIYSIRTENIDNIYEEANQLAENFFYSLRSSKDICSLKIVIILSEHFITSKDVWDKYKKAGFHLFGGPLRIDFINEVIMDLEKEKKQAEIKRMGRIYTQYSSNLKRKRRKEVKYLLEEAASFLNNRSLKSRNTNNSMNT